MSFLENISKNNQYPIIFIGSGITQRYFNNSYSWEELLESLWNEVNEPNTYFTKYHELKTSLENPSKFNIYTKISDQLEKQINDAFFSEKLLINGLTLQQAHKMEISPYKTLVANKIKSSTIKNDIKPEIDSFAKMLGKARQVVTTNYDTFIEDRLNGAIKVNVGNNGLFEPSIEWGELYKIHGSITIPNSIVITSKDYESTNKTSVLVNAKILTKLTESPIIFLGYSLTDENILKLLKDYSENMPFDIDKAAKRIGVVTYKPNESSIVESISEIPELGIHYTKLETDNFIKIYKTISEINQGFSPYEISKYQSAFKKIIDTKGQTGELGSVLTSFVNIENLPSELKSKDLVIAFGDRRYLYKMPDYYDYIYSYFNNINGMPLEIALKYVSRMPRNNPIPIKRYVDIFNKENIKVILPEKELNKIKIRIEKYNNLEDFINTISITQIGIANSKKLSDFKNPISILKSNIQLRPKMLYICKHIKNYSLEDLDIFTNYLFDEYKDRNREILTHTEFRKYFNAYSMIKYGIPKLRQK